MLCNRCELLFQECRPLKGDTCPCTDMARVIAAPAPRAVWPVMCPIKLLEERAAPAVVQDHITGETHLRIVRAADIDCTET